MSTPTTRRAPHNCAEVVADGFVVSMQLAGEILKAHLFRRTPSLRCNLRRGRVHWRGVRGVRGQGGSRGRRGGDSGTLEYTVSILCVV